MADEAEKIVHDAETGEILDGTLAADGRRRHPAVSTLTDLVNMLNDGQFNHDCSKQLGDLAEALEEIGCDTGKKVKGKLTLTIDIEREADGIYFFTPCLKTKTPDAKMPRTIGWVTGENKFTPNRPNQGNLFGSIRDVSVQRDVKN